MLIVIIIFGLIFGSFANALVGRLKAKKEWVMDRSSCDNCGHSLAWYDLVPLLSWLMLRGRCRYCHKPISIQNPIVEIIMATTFGFSFLFWPGGLGSNIDLLRFGLWLAFVVIGVSLAVYDFKWKILPDGLMTTAGAVVGLLWLLELAGGNYDSSKILPTIFSMGIGGGIFYILFQLSKGTWIGGGDVKFGFVYGLLLADPLKSLLVIFLASTLGTVYSIPMYFRIKKARKAQIPFGPFLIIATFLIYIFGDVVTQIYSRALFY